MHKLPIVAGETQRKLEHPEGSCGADFAVVCDGRQGGVGAAPRPDHELTDAAHRVGNPIRCLRGKTLVDVVMTVQQDIDAGSV